MSDIDSEGAWLVGLDDESKILFLATLGHTLTIAGRNSYAPKNDGLANPAQLRRINEIQHRVLACLRELLVGTSSIGFQRSIAEWVLHQTDAELQELMSWAWQSTKEHML
jgi:hypothetical protein